MYRYDFNKLSANCTKKLPLFKGAWVCENKDAYFSWKLDNPIKKGWYRVSLFGDLKGLGLPKIYFDVGSGYNEFYTSTLYPLMDDKSTHTAVVEVVHDVNAIRLNPLEGAGTCDLTEMRLIKLNLLQILFIFLIKIRDIIRQDFKEAPLRLMRSFVSLISGQRIRNISLPSTSSGGINVYDDWINYYDYNPFKGRNNLIKQIHTMEFKPKISVFMVVNNTTPERLKETILSVVNQVYKNWELCICDDGSTNLNTKTMLHSWVDNDRRIKLVGHERPKGEATAYNLALTIVDSDWVALLEAGDILREHALARVAQTIESNPKAELIYSDNDKIDNEGKRYEPHFKPDFSIHLMRSMNYLNHLTVHRVANLVKTGAWRPEYEGVHNFDLNMRVIENIKQSYILHIDEVLYHGRDFEGGDFPEKKALENIKNKSKSLILEHHDRENNEIESVDIIENSLAVRTIYSVPTSIPLISIIIPTRDKADILKVCIESILERTTYLNYEIIIVDNHSEEYGTVELLKHMAEAHENIIVLKYDKPFNYSAINNFAATHAKGEYLCLLNNDTKVITPSWLDEMVSLAAQNLSGCIGSKLYYENERIQHAGVILGIGGVAGHSHKGFPHDSMGYFSRLKVVQNLSAVTGACLLVSKYVYDEVGGLNETNLSIAFNDVDFCLRVREAGYENIWTPFSELYHYESISRGADKTVEQWSRFQSEIDYMINRWKYELYNDPYYSKNLTTTNENFEIRT